MKDPKVAKSIAKSAGKESDKGKKFAGKVSKAQPPQSDCADVERPVKKQKVAPAPGGAGAAAAGKAGGIAAGLKPSGKDNASDRHVKQAANGGHQQAPAGASKDASQVKVDRKRQRSDGSGSEQPQKAAGKADAAPAKTNAVTAVPLKKGVPVSSNWAAMQQAIKAQDQQRQQASAASGKAHKPHPTKAKPGSLSTDSSLTPVLAMDCEMVGVGPNGTKSVLARVCIVNSAGNVLLDTFVRPQEKVTDFRTWVSGVRPADIVHGRPHDEVVAEVARMVRGRIIVGHALHNDFKVLELIDHPKELVRDTSKYPPLMKLLPSGRLIPQSLRELSSAKLGLSIQQGEHSPVDDARCALYLYQKHKKDWDALVRTGRMDIATAATKAKAAKGAKHASKANRTLEAVVSGNIAADPYADL